MPAIRRAARLIVLDATHRLLLVQYRDLAGCYWVPPGGGLADAEDFETAARREADEELGLANVQWLPLWEHTIEYEAHGRTIRQQERFLLACGDIELAYATRRSEHEREGIQDVRWWSVDELLASGARFFPKDLPQRLAHHSDALRQR